MFFDVKNQRKIRWRRRRTGALVLHLYFSGPVVPRNQGIILKQYGVRRLTNSSVNYYLKRWGSDGCTSLENADEQFAFPSGVGAVIVREVVFGNGNVVVFGEDPIGTFILQTGGLFIVVNLLYRRPPVVGRRRSL